MEASIVAVISFIGSGINILSVADALRDRWLVRHTNPPRTDLFPITQTLAINETIRLMIQLIFLALAVDSLVTAEILGGLGLVFLLTIPVILAGQSIYSWVARKRALHEALKPDEDAKQSDK